MSYHEFSSFFTTFVSVLKVARLSFWGAGGRGLEGDLGGEGFTARKADEFSTSETYLSIVRQDFTSPYNFGV